MAAVYGDVSVASRRNAANPLRKADDSGRVFRNAGERGLLVQPLADHQPGADRQILNGNHRMVRHERKLDARVKQRFWRAVGEVSQLDLRAVGEQGAEDDASAKRIRLFLQHVRNQVSRWKS